MFKHELSVAVTEPLMTTANRQDQADFFEGSVSNLFDVSNQFVCPCVSVIWSLPLGPPHQVEELFHVWSICRIRPSELLFLLVDPAPFPYSKRFFSVLEDRKIREEFRDFFDGWGWRFTPLFGFVCIGHDVEPATIIEMN